MLDPVKSETPKLAYAFARKFGVICVEIDDERCLLHGPNTPVEALIEARRVAKKKCKLVQAQSDSEFENWINKIYGQSDLSSTAVDANAMEDQSEDLHSLINQIPKTDDLLDDENDAPIIRLINGILQEAIKLGASDIHIEPYDNEVSVRFRVDGILQKSLSLATRLSTLVVSRIKVMAALDIAKKRVPQDGRFSLALGSRAIDVRVSTIPSTHGERVVLRLLEKDTSRLSLKELGLPDGELGQFNKLLQKPNGIILVTGPTGSGKTTTLYAALEQLNDTTRNILTIEDPIEYSIAGIGQMQVNPQVGVDFASGLRAILRQDPDIVMVGEIRDQETANIAVQAALTGHLVLSTVHTNSAVAAITRLRDIGIEPFLLASTMNGVVAQRLVRRLCSHCKKERKPTPEEITLLTTDRPTPKNSTVFEAIGCTQCNGLGYRGRVGLFEIVTMNEVLEQMVHQSKSELELKKIAHQSAPSLFHNGVGAVFAGTTSVTELLRVTSQQDLTSSVVPDVVEH